MSDDLFEQRENTPQIPFTRYKREERLKNASEKVRQLHNPDFIKRKGLIKSLTATRGLKFIFFAIIIFAAVNFTVFFLTADRNKGKIYGIKCELQSFTHNGKALANLKLGSVKIENTSLLPNLKQSENIELKETVKIQFTFFDKNENKIKSFLPEGIYTGAELRFFAEDETGTAKKIRADILIKDKILSLTKTIN
ncbi:hypothetical protein [Treponema pedis]|uniref:hypothetical protein n=1 Tax=Treponema pedis TaxID=409322 RepID=UPI00041475D4|nr:hypothetical protein [Treponema pedis]